MIDSGSSCITLYIIPSVFVSVYWLLIQQKEWKRNDFPQITASFVSETTF